MPRTMTEADRFRVFGLEPPTAEEEPAAEQPAEEEEPVDENEGANEQEAAEPAEDEESPDEGEPDEEPEPADDSAEEEPPPQSRAERARNAARRREAEKQAAVNAALARQRQEIDSELKEVFGWAGFKDGSKPIESLDEMKAYRKRVQGEQLAKDLQAGKLTPEALAGLVRQEIAAQQPAQPTPTADDAAFRQQVETELAEIRKYDPSIQSVEDLRNLDRAEEFARQVTEHGHTFLDAYRIAYADRISQQAAAAAAQRTRNAERSKAHLKPTSARGAGDVPVPEGVKRNFRRMNPKMTDEEIRKAYQKYARK